MTPEAANIAIAHLLGYKQRIYGGWGQPNDPPDKYRIKDKVYDFPYQLPNFFGSSDAMREALKFMFIHGVDGMRDGQALSAYAFELDKIITRKYRGETNHRRLIAEPDEQAEAFLRVHKKWIESKPNKP